MVRGISEWAKGSMPLERKREGGGGVRRIPIIGTVVSIFFQAGDLDWGVQLCPRGRTKFPRHGALHKMTIHIHDLGNLIAKRYKD